MRNGENYIYIEDGDIILIEDTGIGKSVTNDIENILTDISCRGKEMKNYKVIYRDSDGIIDGIKLDEFGNFKDFYHIGETNYQIAKTKIK